MYLRKVSIWGCLATLAFAIPTDPKIDLALLGPSYAPAANNSLQPWMDAAKQATDAINQIIATGNSTFGPLDNQGTSFSASVFSLVDDKPLFEFHFAAPTLNGSYTKGKLSENTIYRTGSLGKLLSVYTWLVDIGDSVYLDPITKYVVSVQIQGIEDLASTDFFSLNLQMLRRRSRTLSCRRIGARLQLVRLPPSSQVWDVIVSPF